MIMGKPKRKRGKKPAKPTAPEPRTTSSPFYQVVTTPPLQPQVEATPTPTPNTFFRLPAVAAELLHPKHKKGKAAASWIAQVLVVAIPAIVSGYFSHASTKSTAETSYKTLVTAVGELQTATKEVVERQAYMQGEIDLLRGDAARWHGVKVTKRPTPPKAMQTKVSLSTLPSDLGTALKEKDQLPAQQVITMEAPAEIFTPAEKKVLDEAKKKREQEETAKPAPAAVPPPTH